MEKATDLVKQGYLFVNVQEEHSRPYVKLPINLVSADYNPDATPAFEGRANFLLRTSTGEIKFVVVNGFLWQIGEPMPEDINGLVL